MRRLIGTVGGTCALVIATAGGALAHNPPADPLPVNGEPDCFGARVGHSASQHGLTPKAKIAATEGALAALPDFFPAWHAYYDEHGVSVRSIQNWIRINCSNDPIISNP